MKRQEGVTIRGISLRLRLAIFGGTLLGISFQSVFETLSVIKPSTDGADNASGKIHFTDWNSNSIVAVSNVVHVVFVFFLEHVRHKFDMEVF